MAAPLPTILLGPGQSYPAPLCHPFSKFGIKALHPGVTGRFPIPFLNLLLQEVPHLQSESVLFFSEAEIHFLTPSSEIDVGILSPGFSEKCLVILVLISQDIQCTVYDFSSI